MPRQKAQIGMYVTWNVSYFPTHKGYGIIKLLNPIMVEPVLGMSNKTKPYLRWGALLGYGRKILTTQETQCIKHVSYQILLGKLQYRQSFFKNSRNKRYMKVWRQGYQSYKQLCKQYGVQAT